MSTATLSSLAYDDQKYEPISKQEAIIHRMHEQSRSGTWKEFTFFKYGGIIASAVVGLPMGVMFWRAGFRGYGLFRFGKARVFTLTLPLVASGINTGLIHEHFCRPPLVTPFRKENMWYHGFHSALWHQYAVSIAFVAGLGVPFFAAQRMGLLPIPDGMHATGVRKLALDIFFKKMKPYARSLIATQIIGTGLLFLLGIIEYKESCALLALQDRTTISFKERS